MALLMQYISLAQQPDRSTPPALGPVPPYTVPSIQRFALSNGLPIVLIEKHDVPIVQFNLLVRAGSMMEPVGKSGLANMAAAMMMEGAGNRGALALADAIDYLGARITSTSGQHAMAVRLHTPVAQLDSALVLYADIVLRPTLASQELARKRKERLTALLQWRNEPRALSAVRFNRSLYGENHPYGRVAIGNEVALNSLTREDCVNFHAAWYRPNNATLIVVGDVAPALLKQKLETVLGKWGPGTASALEWPAVQQVAKREIIVVDKPGAPQTEIRLGRIGVPRTTPDYFAITVMNTILGGSFTSRLNNNLREQHGYTYSAGSSFDFRPLPGPFLAYAAVQTAVTDKALAEFINELKRIREPVSEEELARAKNYVALSYPAEFQTVGQIAGQLEELVMFNLPDSYFNTYVKNILAVTKEDVQRVARQYIDPDHVAIVLVGDSKVIEGPVSSLKLGPIVHETVDDVLGKAPVLDTKE
jgi:predicted Zn-dependent peptidase